MNNIICYLEAFNSWEFDNGVFHITGMSIYALITGICIGICMMLIAALFRRESKDE